VGPFQVSEARGPQTRAGDAELTADFRRWWIFAYQLWWVSPPSGTRISAPGLKTKRPPEKAVFP
jgi:hypothetical protein